MGIGNIANATPMQNVSFAKLTCRLYLRQYCRPHKLHTCWRPQVTVAMDLLSKLQLLGFEPACDVASNVPGTFVWTTSDAWP